MSLRSTVTFTKKSLKEDIMEEITEKLMEKILDMGNKDEQNALKKFQDTKNNIEYTETNKRTQRGLQQTPK
jgi:hypothetical protein